MADLDLGSLKYGLEVDSTSAEKSIDSFNKSIDRAEQNLKSFDGQSKKSSSMLDKGLSVAITKASAALAGMVAVQKIGQFLKSSTQEFLAFENEMRRANTVMGLTQEQFESMSDAVTDLSTKVPIAADQLASGLFEVASAGISTQNQMAFLTEASKFATAGFTDIETAVKGLTAAMKGFNLEEADATRISDAFFTANKLGQTTIEEMATAIQRMTSSALKANLTLEETTAFFATFTGVTGSASEVATQFRGAINAIVAPTETASNYAKELNAQLGEQAVVLGKGAFEGKNFAEVARDIWNAVDQDAESLRKLIPEQEAATIIIAAATTQYDKFNQSLEELTDGQGAASAAFEEAVKSDAFQLKIAANNWDQFKIKVGESLSGITLFLTRFLLSAADSIEVFSSIIASMAKTLGAVVVGISKSAGLVIEGLLNAVIEKVETTINTLGGFASRLGFDDLADKMTVSFRRVNLVTKDFGDIWGDVGASLTANRRTMVSDISKVITETDSLETTFVNNQIANAVDSIGDSVSGLADTSAGATKNMEDMWEELEDALQQSYDTAIDGIKEFAKENADAQESIREEIEKTEESIKSLKEEFAEETEEAQADFVTDAAEIVVEAQEKLEELKSDLTKLISEQPTDGADRAAYLEDKADLEAQIKEQQALIKSAGDLEIDIQEEIARQKEFNALNELEQLQFKYQQEQQARLDAFNQELADLQTQKLALETSLAEREIEWQEFTDSLVGINENFTAAYEEELASRESLTKSSVDRLIAEYSRLEAAARSAQAAGANISGVGGFATGGFTGKGADTQVAGVVHKNEYVAPAWLVRANPSLFNAIENIRSGGNSPVNNNNQKSFNFTINNEQGNKDAYSDMRLMEWMARYAF